MEHLPEGNGETIPGLTYCKRCGVLLYSDYDPQLDLSLTPCHQTTKLNDQQLAQSILEDVEKILTAQASEVGIESSLLLSPPRLTTALVELVRCMPGYDLKDFEDYITALTWVASLLSRAANSQRRIVYTTYMAVSFEALMEKMGFQAAHHYRATIINPIRVKIDTIREKYFASLNADPLLTAAFINDFELLELHTLLRIFSYLLVRYRDLAHPVNMTPHEEIIHALQLCRKEILLSRILDNQSLEYANMVMFLKNLQV